MKTLTKLKLLSLVGGLLGIQLTYQLRFMPISGKRVDMRGRRVGDPITSPEEAVGFLHSTRQNPKEKTDGTYLLLAEAALDGFYHAAGDFAHVGAATVAADRPSGVSAVLPFAAEDRSAAAAATQAAADEAQGAAGDGADRGRPAWAEALAGPGGPVEVGDHTETHAQLQQRTAMAPTAIIGPTGPVRATSLDSLGER